MCSITGYISQEDRQVVVAHMEVVRKTIILDHAHVVFWPITFALLGSRAGVFLFPSFVVMTTCIMPLYVYGDILTH